MNILLIGASGQIGSELASCLPDRGTLLTVSRAQMDLTDFDQIRQTIRAVQPDLIVNAAAYTDVERAETEPDFAARINGEAPAVIAREAQRLGAALIHYSSDYVFDGSQTVPCDETCTPNPLNAYGRSKLAGELGIAQYCESYWILRCSWVYSTRRKNFLKTVWRLAQERDVLHVVNDQIGAPTWSRSIAEVTSAMLAKATVPENSMQEVIHNTTGIYHFAAAGAASRYDVALHILHRMEQADMPLTLNRAALLPQATADYSSPVKRPLSSRLQTTKLQDVFQLSFPDWRDALDACIDELINTNELN